jgi:Brix domain
MGKKNQAAKRRQQDEEGDEDPKAVTQDDSQDEEDDEEMKRADEEEQSGEENDEAMEQAQDDEEGAEEEEGEEGDDEEGHKHAETKIQPVAPPPLINSDGKYRNKQRCLVLCSRGVTARYRHLMEDLRTLLPHHKKESKLDPGKGGMGRAVNDIAAMRGCNSVLFLECRKRRDCYMWLGHVGGGSSSGNSSSTYTDGPSVKFHVTNVHTMDELRLTGNCMKGSRPILSFDQSFEKIGHLKLIKELFVDVFGTPRGHPKSKPFVDRIMAFYHADKRVSVNESFGKCCS